MVLLKISNDHEQRLLRVRDTGMQLLLLKKNIASQN